MSRVADMTPSETAAAIKKLRHRTKSSTSDELAFVCIVMVTMDGFLTGVWVGSGCFRLVDVAISVVVSPPSGGNVSLSSSVVVSSSVVGSVVIPSGNGVVDDRLVIDVVPLLRADGVVVLFSRT